MKSFWLPALAMHSFHYLLLKMALTNISSLNVFLYWLIYLT